MRPITIESIEWSWREGWTVQWRLNDNLGGVIFGVLSARSILKALKAYASDPPASAGP